MIHQTVENIRTDQRVWDGTFCIDLSEWLGEGTHYWYNDQLVIISPHPDEDDIPVRSGWSLLKWDDGEITVTSPRVVRRLWQPLGRCSSVAMGHTHDAHVWEPQPDYRVRCPGLPESEGR